eukprot:14347477-Alexandrium_andersonii.AAC.1
MFRAHRCPHVCRRFCRWRFSAVLLQHPAVALTHALRHYIQQQRARACVLSHGHCARTPAQAQVRARANTRAPWITETHRCHRSTNEHLCIRTCANEQARACADAFACVQVLALRSDHPLF